jgi:hypothetical protein
MPERARVQSKLSLGPQDHRAAQMKTLPRLLLCKLRAATRWRQGVSRTAERVGCRRRDRPPRGPWSRSGWTVLCSMDRRQLRWPNYVLTTVHSDSAAREMSRDPESSSRREGRGEGARGGRAWCGTPAQVRDHALGRLL